MKESIFFMRVQTPPFHFPPISANPQDDIHLHGRQAYTILWPGEWGHVLVTGCSALCCEAPCLPRLPSVLNTEVDPQ